MLQIEQVTKCFYNRNRGEVRAVDHISCELTAGIVALVGANGAGKSTLLRLIATLLQPDSGTIAVDGICTRQAPAHIRQHLGYLSTTTRVYPRLTAREQLAYAGGFFGLKGRLLQDRIDAVTVQFGLEEFLNQRCDGLSTGQAQRVNLARTLLSQPRILILDEPTTGLDLVAARAVIAAVQKARQPNRLIIIATHVIAEVEALADRLLLMRRGQLVFNGNPAELAADTNLSQAVFEYLDADHRLAAANLPINTTPATPNKAR